MWGTFRLLEKVGEGAYGEVYRAWDTRLDREVALKLLPPDFGDEAAPATSIIEEGRLLARVRHPNVVTIYGAERIEHRIGLWMEFVKGRTLEQILEQGTVLNPSEAVAIGLELARAVSAVHGAGLLHRDIKAHNVMRSEDGRIALMDFGTGRKLDADASLDLAGTPRSISRRKCCRGSRRRSAATSTASASCSSTSSPARIRCKVGRCARFGSAHEHAGSTARPLVQPGHIAASPPCRRSSPASSSVRSILVPSDVTTVPMR